MKKSILADLDSTRTLLSNYNAERSKEQQHDGIEKEFRKRENQLDMQINKHNEELQALLVEKRENQNSSSFLT